MQVCPSCGEENPDRFRLCGFCGTALAPQAPPQEVRKTVTVVFCDLKGSTSLGERLDSEALREVLNVYFAEMKTVLERHGGLVEKYIGDAIMAVFGLPRLHEDDALRAVRASHDMQAALAEVNLRLESRWGVSLQNRTGVNTGEVVAGDPTTGQRLVTGDTVNVAARLEQAAPAMEILLGEPTYRLVRDAVEVEPVEPLELKGKSERIPAYRLVAVSAREGVARRTDTPMVGRTDELALLAGAMGRTAATRRAELVTVLGPAGVGKSRLLQEFLGRAEATAQVLRGRCLSYGEGITFWPLAEIARDAAGIVDDDSVEAAHAKLTVLLGPDARDVTERLASAMGLSETTFSVQETFWAARRLFEELARDRPVVAMVDDIHWAEQTFLDLLRYLVDETGGGLLLLCSSRLELLEEHPDWAEERTRMQAVTLQPLTDDESALVVGNLLGAAALDEAAAGRIVEAAQGNPLFVEQMLSMLIDDGILARDGAGRWVVVSDVGAIAIPPSISALLTARLDRLGPTERTVLERGSVIGQLFYPGAVEDLCPDEIRGEVPPSLESLTRKELVGPDGTTFAGQESYRFRHIMIRDAAYQGLLKRIRAELHERFVNWLEALTADRATEYEEIRGYHLEQAFLILGGMGPLDAHGVEVGARGARYLTSAGERARARGDMPAAANLLCRAAALLPDAGEGRARLLLLAGEAMGEMGQFQAAEDVLSQAAGMAAVGDDPALATTASVARLMWRYLADPDSVPAGEAVRTAREAISRLEELGGPGAHAGLARAWRLMTYLHFYDGTFGPAEEAARNAVRHAGIAGDRVLEVRLLSAVASCLVYSPTPVPQAIDRCAEILEQGGGERKTEAMAYGSLSHLEAMRGDFARARELYGKSRAILSELGFRLSAATTSLESGPVEMLATNPAEAERELRGDFETLEAMGERAYMPSVAGFLAEALYAQGRDDEADRFAGICEEFAAPDDVGSQYLWRCARAKVLARRGEAERAEELAREGVRLIETTDQPDAQGEAMLSLAEVLRLCGRHGEAGAAAERAQALFEAKGNVVSAARAAAFRDQLGPVGAGR